LAQLAVAPAGGAVLGWHTRETSGALYRSPSGAIERTTGSGVVPSGEDLHTVAIGEDGTAVDVSSTIDGAVTVKVRPPGGRWGPERGLGITQGADAAVVEDGTVFVAFSPPTFESGLPLRVGRRSPSGDWSFEELPSTRHATFARLAAGGGVVLAVWREVGEFGARTMSSVRRDGAWQSPQQIAAVSTPSSLALDHRGNALAIWGEFNDAEDTRAVYAARRPAGGSWSDPHLLDSGAPSGDSEGPQVAVDEAGNALAAWLGSGAPGRPPTIKLARFDAFAAAWEEPAVIAEAPQPPRGSPRTPPVLDVGGAGEAVVVWVDRGTVRAARGSSLSGRFGAPEIIGRFEAATTVLGPLEVGVDREGRALAVFADKNALRLATRSPGGGDEGVKLTAQQLLINQRISQAALVRANAALDALDRGLPAAALREGGLTGEAFGSSVTLAGAPSGAERPAGERYQVPVPDVASSRPGPVRLTAAQLRINQRIAQAAVRQSNALAERLARGLAGRDLAEGAVTASKLAPGLSVAASGPPPPHGTDVEVPEPRTNDGGEVRLTAAQLAINQRISQAAVRRSNLVLAILESGLTTADFAPGGLTSRELQPELR
jgi:hypothetical protein